MPQLLRLLGDSGSGSADRAQVLRLVALCAPLPDAAVLACRAPGGLAAIGTRISDEQCEEGELVAAIEARHGSCFSTIPTQQRTNKSYGACISQRRVFRVLTLSHHRRRRRSLRRRTSARGRRCGSSAP
jgi:hypothetical protein